MKKIKKVLASALAVIALLVTLAIPTVNAISSADLWRDGNTAIATMTSNTRTHLRLYGDLRNRTTGALLDSRTTGSQSITELRLTIPGFTTNRSVFTAHANYATGQVIHRFIDRP